MEQVETPLGDFGKMNELSKSKDTMTGHWELMGLFVDKPFRTFENGFPDALISQLEEETGRKIIGNCVASGTEIIKELGAEHVDTGALSFIHPRIRYYKLQLTKKSFH
ncbi:phosphopentomutase [Geomicrobium sp. JCM 19037]|nr:phosphopentomutase [Geomicrobium sp. JCM 19037]